MAKIERTKNTIIGAAWGTIEKTASIIAPFIVRTILIKKLGIEYLGLSSLFSSILQVLNLTELGFGVATVYAMYKPVAEDDYETVGSILLYLNKIYKLIGLIIIGLGIIVTPFLKDLIKGDIPSDVNVYILFWIYIINTAASYLLFAYKSLLLNALQLNGIISKVHFWANMGMRICQILVLLIIPNYYIYVILLPICTIIINIVNSAIVDKKYGQWLVKAEINLETKKDIRSRIFPLMSIKLAVVLVNSADTLVISYFLGLKDVAMYNNYYYIMNSSVGFLLVIYGAMQAGIGNTLVTDSHTKIMNDFYRFSFINYWVVAVCTSGLLCLYQPFMRIWVGEGMMLSFEMVIMFCIYFFSITSLRIVVIYKDAGGIWKQDMFRCYLSCGINLLLNIITVRFWGLYGVIGSSVFVCTFIDPWIGHNLFKYLFKESSSIFYVKWIKAFIVTAVVSIICLISSNFMPDGLMWFLMKAMICFCLSNILLLLIYRKDEFFDPSVEWLKRKIFRLM